MNKESYKIIRKMLKECNPENVEIELIGAGDSFYADNYILTLEAKLSHFLVNRYLNELLDAEKKEDLSKEKDYAWDSEIAKGLQYIINNLIEKFPRDFKATLEYSDTSETGEYHIDFSLPKMDAIKFSGILNELLSLEGF